MSVFEVACLAGSQRHGAEAGGVGVRHGPGRPGTPRVSAAAWSPDFEKAWELDPEEGLVADCYALNVGAAEVVACPYTDFPVVRIQDRKVTVAATSGVSGPAGIVAHGDQVGIIGTYRDPSLLITGAIRDGACRESARVPLLAPDGAPLPTARVHCRGSVAHFLAGRTWYSFDLENDA